MAEKNRIFINKRIGILGKGGSGKSTVTVLLSQALKKLGYQIIGDGYMEEGIPHHKIEMRVK